jgi:hypothetical protein
VPEVSPVRPTERGLAMRAPEAGRAMQDALGCVRCDDGRRRWLWRDELTDVAQMGVAHGRQATVMI